LGNANADEICGDGENEYCPSQRFLVHYVRAETFKEEKKGDLDRPKNRITNKKDRSPESSFLV
jgi:hypothetical protein